MVIALFLIAYIMLLLSWFVAHAYLDNHAQKLPENTVINVPNWAYRRSITHLQKYPFVHINREHEEISDEDKSKLVRLLYLANGIIIAAFVLPTIVMSLLLVLEIAGLL